MSSDKRFGLLRNLLRTIGLSQESADQVVDFIVDLLAGEGKGEGAAIPSAEFPYHLRDHFLSPAELSFCTVLRTAINGRAALCSKVALADLFYVKKGDDASRWRIYTNKIDRKHVDFLLCDPATMRPLVGIELDDSSHQREDRQSRDKFVDGVFAAAKLPLVHIPVKRAYVTAEIEAQIAPYLAVSTARVPTPVRVVETPLPKTVVQTNVSMRAIIKWEDSGLWRQLFNASSSGTEWNIQPYFSETVGNVKGFYFEANSPGNITGSSSPYSIKIMANNVVMQVEQGTIRLEAGNIVMFSVTIDVLEPSGTQDYIQIALDNATSQYQWI